MAKKIIFDKNYFVLPATHHILTVSAFIPFCMVTAYNPALIPESLGFVRTASFYLAENYPILTMVLGYNPPIVHGLEAVYAAYLCSNAGMTTSTTVKWVLSTLVFGFSSVLLKLRPYLQNAKKSQP
ncbi:hypothetical protein RRG08_050900 [Elysia crispata]|uniref:Transmembrane protein 254 n=1 Tax=Elysia crispata TaxID=231223 RepID=A0AAE0ZTH8_9GAST|nr:hypothetical protein RRG08_050900 [Elysia crispata]